MNSITDSKQEKTVLTDLQAANAPTSKEYLGDSVYAEVRGDWIKLTTNNRGVDSNTIILNPTVIKNLIRISKEE